MLKQSIYQKRTWVVNPIIFFHASRVPKALILTLVMYLCSQLLRLNNMMNSIWRFLHGKVQLRYSKKGNFWQALPAPQIKIFKKKGKFLPTEWCLLSEKNKKFGYWIKARQDILPQRFEDRHTDRFSDSSSTKVENIFFNFFTMSLPYKL